MQRGFFLFISLSLTGPLSAPAFGQIWAQTDPCRSSNRGRDCALQQQLSIKRDSKWDWLDEIVYYWKGCKNSFKKNYLSIPSDARPQLDDFLEAGDKLFASKEEFSQAKPLKQFDEKLSKLREVLAGNKKLLKTLDSFKKEMDTAAPIGIVSIKDLSK